MTVAHKHKDIVYEDEYAENIFLDLLLGKLVNVFLLTGVRLTGEMLYHDPKSIVLRKNSIDQLVYKRSIASVSQLRTENRGEMYYD